jgi:hypothetical protein
MPVLVVTKQIRPNTNIPFLDLRETVSENFKSYFQTNYLDTGKYLGTADSSISDDGLVLTTSALWESFQDHDQFANDPMIQENMLNAYANYNLAHGITRELVSKTEL